VRRQTPIARQVLDRLLEERIAWTPHPDEGLYMYKRRLKFDTLLSRISVTEGSTSPTGDAREWTRDIPGEVPAVGKTA
jgi:hypothetical protein